MAAARSAWSLRFTQFIDGNGLPRIRMIKDVGLLFQSHHRRIESAVITIAQEESQTQTCSLLI